MLVKSRGLCRRHYLRWQRHGDPLAGGTPVGDGSCAVDGCLNVHEAKGLCKAHYMSQQRHGDPLKAKRRGSDPRSRFDAKVQKMTTVPRDRARPDLGPCWLWTGSIIPNSGYGQVRRDGVLYVAHRVAYTDAGLVIPDGLDLDHLCRVRHCVRPTHLEPVTRGENLRRGYEARRS